MMIPRSTVLTLLLLSPTTASPNIASGSSARLPASLSSVINDLEAEGASRITTAAFLSSHGVTRKSRATLLRTLFGVTEPSTPSDDEDAEDTAEDESVEVVDGITTAFGKKLETDTIVDDGAEDLEAESVGIAVANPLPTATVTEIAATVHACGGNVVFVAGADDLSRGEGLFDALAPAIERVLNGDDSDAPSPSRTLVVVVEGATTQHQLLEAKSRLEAGAETALASIVRPTHASSSSRFDPPVTLQDVFENVEYVGSDEPVDAILADVAASYDPSEAAAGVSRAVFGGVDGGRVPELATPLDLAAARRLLPLSHGTRERCRAVVRRACAVDPDAVTEDEEEEDWGDVKVVPDFGGLSDAAVKSSLEAFDEAATDPFLRSPVASRIRSDLREGLYADLEALYVRTLDLLYDDSVAEFKQALSKLRLSPNLQTDMQDAAAAVLRSFSARLSPLRSTSPHARGWPAPQPWATRLRRELREYVSLRIRTARADGKFKPAPRKGATLGFHWLLPKPFGNDYRLEPWQRHTKDSVVYIPKDKITDVGAEDLQTGDWRKGVVPCPTGKEMMYLK